MRKYHPNDLFSLKRIIELKESDFRIKFRIKADQKMNSRIERVIIRGIDEYWISLTGILRKIMQEELNFIEQPI